MKDVRKRFYKAVERLARIEYGKAKQRYRNKQPGRFDAYVLKLAERILN